MQLALLTDMRKFGFGWLFILLFSVEASCMQTKLMHYKPILYYTGSYRCTSHSANPWAVMVIPRREPYSLFV